MICVHSQFPAQRRAPRIGTIWGARRIAALIGIAIAMLTIAPLSARAAVFHSKESALQLAFPQADSITTRTLILTSEQSQQINREAGTVLPSRIVNVYVEWREGVATGFGMIDTHKVRSLPETLMIVIEPAGRLRAVHLLAFHEPDQYRGPERWFAQFQDHELDAELLVRRSIAGIAGSTLTANAVTASVRRALALYEVILEPESKVTAVEPTSPHLTGGF